MASKLQFRNVTVQPDDPVSQWPHEGFACAIERGTISDWRVIAHEIKAHPFGSAAATLEEVLEYVEPNPVSDLLSAVLVTARQRILDETKHLVQREVVDLVASSNLTVAEFARRAGTSRTRLSTYLSGVRQPSLSTLARMRAVS